MTHFSGFQKVKVGTPGVKDAGKHANYDVFSVPQSEETAEGKINLPARKR